ncbi:hypothetical protein EZS27_011216 [termite gut metagenome]|uniref:Uncharacterized protein n=1 Tax=termite gut metagenome TaxID=433724 RepID=A0A5J4S3Z5_9ZZZZ
MDSTRILVILFKNSIAGNEISFFRGAVIHALNEQANVLFHNHQEEKFRYAYPLIQYKKIRGRAAIVCINEGTEAVGQFFSACNFTFRLGDREVEMEIDSVKPQRFLVQVWDSMFRYCIRKWLPLNSDNYQKYNEMEGIGEKTAFMERILTGNILSFAKGIERRLDKEVICKLTGLRNYGLVDCKGVKLMAFDGEFQCNVSLPDYVGIGKSTSVGFGVITRM